VRREIPKPFRPDLGRLSASWLRHGELLSPVQRIGHAMFSLVCLGLGVSLTSETINALLDSPWSFAYIPVAAYGLVFLFVVWLGLSGLVNVLRFPRRQKHSGRR